jgi:hypothetical protein
VWLCPVSCVLCPVSCVLCPVSGVAPAWAPDLAQTWEGECVGPAGRHQEGAEVREGCWRLQCTLEEGKENQICLTFRLGRQHLVNRNGRKPILEQTNNDIAATQ